MSPQSAALRSEFKPSCGIGTVMPVRKPLDICVERKLKPGFVGYRETGNTSPPKGRKDSMLAYVVNQDRRAANAVQPWLRRGALLQRRQS